MTHHEVVAALIVRSGMILLGRRSGTRAFYPDVWDLFGGHVETGEQQPETRVRELQEELDITPTRWKFLETLTVSLPGHDHDPPELSTETSTASSLTVHLYLVTAWTGRPTNRQPEEHSAIGWFSLDQATGLDLADSTYPMLFQRHLKCP
jgi:8-oxo-dGTP pyrophosphatase MutT (NUDIX family)